MKENAIRFGKDRSLIGVLTEKGNTGFNEDSRTGVLLLSSGLDHHVGPNRIYVKLARRLAESGTPVFRFGFSGIGDSGPRMDKLPVSESVIDETRQAMDRLGDLRGTARYCCIGLCSGANVAAAVLRADQRVEKAVLINPLFTRVAHGILGEQSIVYREYALSNINSWIRLLTLRSDFRRIWRTVRAGFEERIKGNKMTLSDNYDIEGQIREFFQAIQTRNVRILMVFSHTEFGDIYLKKVLGKEYRSLVESGVLDIRRIKNADHSITQLVCQNELMDVISGFLSQPDSGR